MRKFTNKIEKVVIKIGSSSITHDNGCVNIEKIDMLTKEIVNLKNKGIDVILVSSGAIAAGKNKLQIQNTINISEKQAIASVGQLTLMNTYLRSFAEYGYSIAQMLLTRMVETDAIMHENAINTFETLLKMNVIPIVNENDSISTFEINFGDNDTLSAVVSKLVNADLLILLSDIDGLYTDDPRVNNNATIIKEVNIINDKLREMGKGTYSKVGTGGMATKINAANICMESGIDVVIANSSDFKNIRKILGGEEIGTIFKGIVKRNGAIC
ncbi:MAG: glutamate 5-kinase [Peptoniphilaceae bacterium]|nr:glutamate 5-kinase [Peptoniphilaceae bacterium]MDD7383678.1 glutamate 5-kinase [Peptoniphilaceae bacterium]MDY3738775.1 glutamate 5-kinase [Peptoniphilaceae bacterium]